MVKTLYVDIEKMKIIKQLTISKKQGKITDAEARQLASLMKGMSVPEFYLVLGYTLGD